MKIRTGFVSNSSSSSFLCDACGEADVGYDGQYENIDVIHCELEHEFCKHHYKGESENNYLEPKECPVCTLAAVNDTRMLVYLRKKLGVSYSELLKEVQEKFTGLEKLEEFLKQ